MANSVTFDLFARDRSFTPTFRKAGQTVDETGKKVRGLNGAFGAITAGSRGLRTSFGLIGKGAALAAGAAGIGGLIEGFKGVYSEAREAQKVSAQTAAVIKSTGGVAKVSADQVGDLATAISNKVGVDDEAIQSGANLLLTFKGIRNEAGRGNNIFDQATQTITDMAAAMNQGTVSSDGLKTASIQVGKALNDPLKGITALTKVGVTFTDGQKKQIKSLVEHGKTLEAQKIILKELNSEFAGSAQAGTTASQKLGVVFGNIKESIGTALLPAIDAVSTWLADKLPRALNKASSIAGPIFRKLGDGFAALGAAFSGEGVTSDGFIGVMERIGDAGRQLVERIKSTVTGIKQRWAELKDGFTLGIRTTAFQSLGTNAFEVFQAIKRRWDEIKAGFTLGIRTTGLERFGSDLWEAVQKAKRFVEDKKPTINLGSIARNFGDQAQTWATNIIDGIETGLTKGDWSQLGQTVGTGILTAIGAAADLAKKLAVKIGDLFAKVDWVGLGITVGKAAVPFFVGLAAGLLNFDMVGLIKGVMAHWSDILLAAIALFLTPVRVVGKVAELLARIPLVGEFLAWGLRAIKGFVDGMGKAILKGLGSLGKSFLEGFARVFPGIENGFLTHLRNLPTYIGVVTLEVIAKAKLMLRSLGKAIGDGIGGVVAKIGELIGRMLKPFANAGGWLLRRGVEFVGGLARGISGAIGSAAAAVGRVKSALMVRFVGASKWLVSAGGELIRGLLNGARGALSGVGQWIKDIGNRIISAVKSFFKISSPSKVFAELGGHLITGLIQGMADKNPTALITKVFGGMTGALKSLFGKGLLGTAANLSSKALDALGLSLSTTISGSGSFGGNNEDIVRSMAATLYGWTGAQWTALRALLMGESGFNSNAQNPTSTAYGLFQFLDSTWAAVGAHKTSDPGQQTAAGLRYIAGTYGNPVNAFSAWLNRTPHWYGTGLEPTMFNRPTLIGVGERGPEMVSVTPQRMLQPGRGGAGNTYHISVSVPVGANPRETGRQLVEAIRAYEKGSGAVLAR